jgi:CBS-domain-containing membrane protein
MKRIATICIVAALAIGGGIFYLLRPGHPTTGQPPLVEITGPALADFHAEFNRTPSSLRVILLLSPT